MFTELELFNETEKELVKRIKNNEQKYWMGNYDADNNHNNWVAYRHDIVECKKQIFIYVYPNKVRVKYRNSEEEIEFTRKSL